MKRQLIVWMMLIFASPIGIWAQNITVTTNDGVEHEVTYRSNTIKGNGIILNDNKLLRYDNIEIVSTNHFDAYERAMKKTRHEVSIQFTGDRSYYAQKLEKLQKNRTAANATMGAGGLIMLVGALSGDRDLYNAGVVTYGAGRIGEIVNTEKTLATQSSAIVDMEQQQKQMQQQMEQQQRQQEAKELEAKYRAEYGNENVDAVFALMEKQYVRSLALANAGETSKNFDHQLSAVWIKAMNYAEKNEQDLLAQEYQKIAEIDPEVATVEEAERWMVLLLEDLGELRKM